LYIVNITYTVVWTMISSMPEATTSSAHNDKCNSES
jgi:hypothetical protein